MKLGQSRKKKDRPLGNLLVLLACKWLVLHTIINTDSDFTRCFK